MKYTHTEKEFDAIYKIHDLRIEAYEEQIKWLTRELVELKMMREYSKSAELAAIKKENSKCKKK